MKISKRIPKVFVMFLMVMTMMAMSSGIAHAATPAATKKIYKAYAAFLQKQGYASHVRDYEGNPNLSTFQVAYIDGNSVPDLVILSSFTDSRIGEKEILYLTYTYRNGKVVQTGIGTADKIYGYYKKKNVIGIYSNDSINKMQYVEYIVPSTRYMGNGTLGKSVYKGKTTKFFRYSNVAKQITKSQFISYRKKLIGTTKITKFAAVRNTAANRKRVLGY